MYDFRSNLRKSLLIVTFIFLASITHWAQNVKIEQKNGVTVIINPKKPVLVPGGPKSLTLTEDLCLGDEPHPDYLFASLRALKVDNEEDIIVLDWKLNQIMVFNKEGKFIRSFGKQGQGPKELQSPSRMYLKAGKAICIMDSGNNRIAYYSKEGECLQEIQMVKYRAFRIIPDSRSYFYGDVFTFDKQIKFQIIKLDPNYTLVQTIAEYERGQADARPSPVIERFVYCVLPDDQLVWAITSKYEIHFVSPSGKLTRTVSKEYDRLAISEKEKKLLI